MILSKQGACHVTLDPVYLYHGYAYDVNYISEIHNQSINQSIILWNSPTKGAVRPLSGLGTRLSQTATVQRFSNLDAVFTEIRIFPCHQAYVSDQKKDLQVWVPVKFKKRKNSKWSTRKQHL